MPRRERKLRTRYLAGFGRVRSEFTRYSSLGLVSQIVEYLYHDFDLSSVEQLRKAPWVQSLLIKWILTDPGYNENKPVLSLKQALKVMNKAWVLSGRARLPTEFTDTLLFMRAVGFQQLRFQVGISPTQLARQRALFGNLQENHRLKTDFLAAYGINILDFLELSLAVVAKFESEPTPVVTRAFFDPLHSQFSSETIDRFLAAISIELLDLRSYLTDVSPDHRVPEEFLEQTPLYRFPLLRQGGQFLCWYPTILYRCLETFIYDSLKAIDAARLMDRFGGIFEEYVVRAVEHSGVAYFVEEQLMPLLPESKCVDLIVLEAGGLIFIDAKGVEMADVAKSAHHPKIIKDRTRSIQA